MIVLILDQGITTTRLLEQLQVLISSTDSAVQSPRILHPDEKPINSLRHSLPEMPRYRNQYANARRFNLVRDHELTLSMLKSALQRLPRRCAVRHAC